MMDDLLYKKVERIENGSNERLTKDEANMLAALAIKTLAALMKGYSLSPLSEKQLFQVASNQLQVFINCPI